MSNTKTFLANPFTFYGTIVIPAGTEFTTEDPKRPGVQVVKRQMTNRVEMTSRGFAQQFANELWESEPTVSACATSGWFKEIVLTEELILANGLPVTYEEIRVIDSTDRTV